MTQTDSFNEPYEVTLKRYQVNYAGQLVLALYRKLKAEQIATLKAANYTLWAKQSDLTVELAGILGALGFDTKGNQR